MFYNLWLRAARFFGLVPRWEVELLMLEQIKADKEVQVLIQEISSLNIEKAELKEENDSLWLMLDEMGQSETLSKTNINELLEDLQDTIVEEMLRDFDPVGDA